MTLEQLWPAQHAWTLEPDGSRTLRVSPSSLERFACEAKYMYYKLHGRIGAEERVAPLAGRAFHAGAAAWKLGKSIPEQDAAILQVFEQAQAANGAAPDPDEYRCASYVQDALAQYRANYAKPRWTTLHVEQELEVPLIERHEVSRDIGEAEVWRVMLQVRIDEAIRDDQGRLWLVDSKTSSQDRGDDLAAYRNSLQFKLYAWAYEQKYGEPPVGIIPDRVIMRRPVIRKSDKTKPTFEFPPDQPVTYDSDLIAEAVETTRRTCRRIIANLHDPDAWRQNEAICVGRWGTCDYLPVCERRPSERLLKLATDTYRDATKI